VSISRFRQTRSLTGPGPAAAARSRTPATPADVIGIPFYVWDMAERFARDVVDDFVAEYAAGRTPNPCLRCNEKIKFEAVLDRALALGFDAVCTGHYAQVSDGALQRAVDPGKDQSYVLAVLNKDQIAHAIFPLGDTPKSEVREEARSRGLLVADKPDSHDVCFIADGDTRGFLSRKLGSAPGTIVDQDGAVLGAHEGVHGFTIGQRKGLHLDRPAPDGNPRYVLSIEPVSNTVTVGPADALGVREITAIRPVWTGCEPPLIPIECTVQLRAHGEVHPCTAQVSGEELHIYLNDQARGVAAGQAAVLYSGNTVLGSATISATSVPAESVALAGHLAVPVPELVSVHGIDGRRDADAGPVRGKSRAVDQEHRRGMGQVEAQRLIFLGRTCCDQVLIANLLEPEGRA
jgi:tRNA-uridine 2-sulfurtransferase